MVDLGCGPGNLTALLAERWPGAACSASTPARRWSRRRAGDVTGIGFEVADLRDWRPAQPVDVLVSNATLQWVPGHLDLLPRLVGQVAPGGWFAFQVPGNFDEPSHTIRRELAAEAPYAAHTAGVAVPASHDPAVYLDALAGLGCTVDAWETTYLHVLTGEDPVFTWVSGTGARPDAAGAAGRPAGASSRRSSGGGCARRTRSRRRHGVVLPFRRVFVVARVRAGRR